MSIAETGGGRVGENPLADAVRLDVAYVEEAADALADAFLHDPLMSYALPDATERRAKLPLQMALGLRCGYSLGEAYATPGPPLGAAVWFPPGGWEVSPEQLEHMGLEALTEAIGSAAVERYVAVEEYLSELHRRDMAEPHWFLALVGVRRAHQGRGLGSALLRPILDRADADGVPCYLETEQPKNLSYYERHGFRVLASGTEPTSGLAYWTMRRDPGNGATVV